MAEETATGSSTAAKPTEEKPATTIDQLSGEKVGGRKDWGNMLVVNTGRNPVVNFNFMLRVEGVFDLPCKAVKGIRRENEFDYIQEGGLNDYVHLKRKAITKPFTFQVERYVGVNWIDPMPLGTELVLPLILFVNSHVFPGLQPVRNYVFTGCTVIGKDYGELNAEASGLLLETVTIAYREMICLDIPSDTYKSDDVWRFKGKEKEGAGDRHYNANLYNQDWEKKYSSQDKMETRAEKNRYKHSKIAKKNVAAETSQNELTQTQMEGKAARWKPEKDTDGSLKSKYGRDYEAYATDYNKAIDEEIKNAKTPEEKAEAEAKRIAMSGAENRKYVHTKNASRDGSATYQTNELTRENMEKNAARWKPEKDADGSLKSKYGRDYEAYATDYNKAIDEEIKNAKTPKEKEEAKAKRIVMSGIESRKYVHTQNASRSGSATYDTDELSRAEMEEKAVLYKHSGTASREGSATYPADELTREEMEKNAARWKPEKDADGSLKVKYGKDYEAYAADYNAALNREAENAETAQEKADAEAKKIAMSGIERRKYVHTRLASRDGSAAYPADELTREEMEDRARRWPPVKSARQITEYLKKN